MVEKGSRTEVEGHCRRRGGLRTPGKSARQLCGMDFHKLHSMGHWYKEDIRAKEGGHVSG